MKKLFLAACLIATVFATNAQLGPAPKAGPVTQTYFNRDTTINTDTTNVELLSVGSKLASIGVDVKLLTGTIGGKVVLYGRVGGNYELLDSGIISAAATFKIFKFARVNFGWYTDYKVQYRTATMQTSYIVATAMRRPDE